MKMKYVIMDDTLPIVFHPGIQHVNICRRDKITSAGFCHISSETGMNGDIDCVVDCFGKSVSLNIESKEGDAKKIKDMIESILF